MASTYTPIATTTLGSNQSTVTFSSIPSTYTDLVLVCNATVSSANGTWYLEFNSDTGTNYSATVLKGNGTAASSDRLSTIYGIPWGGWSTGAPTTANNAIIQINNYSNTTTYKSVLSRWNNSAAELAAIVGLWRSTAAINSITLYAGYSSTPTPQTNVAAGSTFTLYGITAA